MRIQQRSYGGKYFLPKPHVEYDPGLDILLVSTAWGDGSAAKFATDAIKEKAGQISENTEVTRIAKHIQPVADEKGVLSKNFEQLNTQILKKYNDLEYTASVELLTLEKKGNLCSWHSVGSPSLLIFNGKSLVPIANQIAVATNPLQKAPLANLGLGVFPHFYLSSGSFRVSQGITAVLISRDSLPENLFNPMFNSLDEWAGLLAQADAEKPFWIATVEFTV